MAFVDAARPLVFAHRGGCALGPENTVAAFDLGLAAGADGLEFDVHLSADGIAVVHHDRTLDRTTTEAGPVAARKAVELGRIDAGFSFSVGGTFPFRSQGIGIPTLGEVLQRYPDVPIVIDMKVDSREMGEAVAHEVRRAGAVERVCAAGYGARSAAAVRAALPEMAFSACHAEVRVALFRTWAGWPVRRVAYASYQIPEVAGRLRIVSPRFIRYAHASGLKVHAWTVDDEPDMRRLLAWGVDGLVTNRPNVAARIVRDTADSLIPPPVRATDRRL